MATFGGRKNCSLGTRRRRRSMLRIPCTVFAANSSCRTGVGVLNLCSIQVQEARCASRLTNTRARPSVVNSAVIARLLAAVDDYVAGRIRPEDLESSVEMHMSAL